MTSPPLRGVKMAVGPPSQESGDNGSTPKLLSCLFHPPVGIWGGTQFVCGGPKVEPPLPTGGIKREAADIPEEEHQMSRQESETPVSSYKVKQRRVLRGLPMQVMSYSKRAVPFLAMWLLLTACGVAATPQPIATGTSAPTLSPTVTIPQRLRRSHRRLGKPNAVTWVFFQLHRRGRGHFSLFLQGSPIHHGGHGYGWTILSSRLPTSRGGDQNALSQWLAWRGLARADVRLDTA